MRIAGSATLLAVLSLAFGSAARAADYHPITADAEGQLVTLTGHALTWC